MARTWSEWSEMEAAGHRARAIEARRLAAESRAAGFRDQAARHLIDARLHDLKAAALDATTRAAA